MQSARLFPNRVALLAVLTLTAATASAQTTAPTTPVGSTSAVQTATLTFSENATVASINVLTQGAANLDFRFASGGTCTVGTSYTTGQTCTVNYTFSPTHPGPRYGAVALYDSVSPARAAATTYLQGAGNGPQVTFSPVAGGVLSTSVDGNGVAVDGSGNLFIVDREGNTVKEMLAAGGYTNVVTLGSGFHTPQGVAVDGAGNVFVADSYNEKVKEIVAAGGYSTVITLPPSQIFANQLTIDGSGNLFVAGGGGNLSIKELTVASGYSTVVTLGGGNLGSGFAPVGIAVDQSGNVYIGDQSTHHVRKILAAGGYTTVQIIGPSTPQINVPSPGGVALDGDGNVFVTYNDGTSNPDGFPNLWIKEATAQSGYTSTRAISSLGYAGGLALDGGGNIYVPDLYSDPDLPNAKEGVGKIELSSPPTLSFSTTAAGSTSTDSPQTVTVTNNGNRTLNISAVSYGHDFPEASGVPTDCTSSTDLAASASCTLSIDFSPLRTSATGPSTPLAEQVTLTDNNLNVTNAEQAVAVSGTETFTPPALTTPTPGATIGSSSATFTWNPGSATTFQFRLGTTLGSNNIYGSGQTNATSETVSGLPTAVTIYARLYYMLDNTWKPLDYTYPGTPAAPKLTTPTPGTTLSGSTVTFTWNPGSYTTFQFRLGTTLGSNNIYGSGQTTKTSETVSGLPTNGETIHARLYYMVGSAWQFTDYTYTAQ